MPIIEVGSTENDNYLSVYIRVFLVYYTPKVFLGKIGTLFLRK